MTSSALNNKQEKYYFTMNIFDEGHEDVEEEILPSFSEEELAAAKAAAFEDGKKQGLDEAQASRSQLIAETLEIISGNISTLLECEQQRETLFEEEVVRLTLAGLKKLFPVLLEKHGDAELMHSLEQTLKAQHSRKDITVHVTPDATEGVQKMLSALSEKGLNVTFTVSPDENLAHGTCKLAWTDGGAIINREALAQEILNSMQQMLADEPTNRHDSEDSRTDAEDGPIGNEEQSESDTNTDMMENPNE